MTYSIKLTQNAPRLHLLKYKFQNFPGGMPPDPPRMSILRMLSVLRTLFTYTIVCRYRPVGWGAPLALSALGPLISVGSPVHNFHHAYRLFA